MGGQSADQTVGPETAADILVNMATLMGSLHESDFALQNALSILTSHAEHAVAMHELQHIDLVTQVHSDLSRMLPILAQCLHGQPTTREDLCAALSLKSLQDALIHPDNTTEAPLAGELSLF